MHTTSTTTPQIHEKLSINPTYSSQNPHTYTYILATTAHTTSQIQLQQLQHTTLHIHLFLKNSKPTHRATTTQHIYVKLCNNKLMHTATTVSHLHVHQQPNTDMYIFATTSHKQVTWKHIHKKFKLCTLNSLGRSCWFSGYKRANLKLSATT